MLSKSGLALPWIVEAALKMKQQPFIIDGRICVLDVQGTSGFNALHSNRHNDEAQLHALYLVALDGDDLRDLPLLESRFQINCP